MSHSKLTIETFVSASSPLVGFGELNDNTMKGLTSLLSVEQGIKFIAYTCGLWNGKCIYVQQEGKLDDIPHNVQIKAKIGYCCIGRSRKQYSSRERQQCKWSWWNSFYVEEYHSIMRKQAYLANIKRDMSWWFWIGLNNGLLCMQEEFDSRLALINDWRMSQECISEEIPSKCLYDKGHNSY